MNGYPIQPAKVQRPPLRDETLARDRLLDWLRRQDPSAGSILVLADAGLRQDDAPGRLLAADAAADALVPARRRRPRLDLVPAATSSPPAGSTIPAFAPTTAAMLSDLAMGGPTREAATDVFLRELPTIAEHGAVLILDDFHLVDESPDVRHIARELVARAPGAAVDRVRQPADAADPARPAARRRARSPSSAPTTSGSTRPRPRGCSPRPTGASSSPTSSPTSPRGPKAGQRRSSSSRPRCATGRRPRSGASSGA